MEAAISSIIHGYSDRRETQVVLDEEGTRHDFSRHDDDFSFDNAADLGDG